jgi:hypothetical protein
MRYAKTAKGRANRIRHGRGERNLVRHRRHLYGAEPHHVEQLLKAQTGADGIPRCPLTLKPVDAKSPLDHAHGLHGPDALRGILRPRVNGVIGGSDEEMYGFAERVRKYASRRRRFLTFRRCEARPRTVKGAATTQITINITTTNLAPRKRRASRTKRRAKQWPPTCSRTTPPTWP